MTVAAPDALIAEIVAVLRGAGARFGLLHGSRVAGLRACGLRYRRRGLVAG